MAFASIGLFIFTACESDADDLGEQFFESESAKGNQVTYDLVAYNVNNHDSLRSDATRLAIGYLGAFSEDVFGGEKAAYVTQARLMNYNPKFGTNPVVDSVQLEIRPMLIDAQDSIKEEKIQLEKDEDGNEREKIITRYKISKYGKSEINGAPAKLTLHVDEVTDFLFDTTKEYYSDHQVNLGAFLGSVVLEKPEVVATKVVQKENNVTESSTEAVITVPLDKSFFQSKIVNAEGQTVLNDAASFIRYFGGIRISVEENDGYLFGFLPENLVIKMFYSNDITKDGETTRQSNVATLDLGSANARFNQYAFNRPSGYQNAMQNIDPVNGDNRLFVQGTGGSGAAFKIPDATIQALKNLYTNDKIGIVSARIRVYSAVDDWNKKYPAPDTFTVLKEGVKGFLNDITTLLPSGLYQQVKKTQPSESSNEVYYDISITQTLKDMVEKNAENRPLEINVGTYQTTQSQTGVPSFLGWNRTSRAYTPNRIVLIGTDQASGKKAQLQVIYTRRGDN